LLTGPCSTSASIHSQRSSSAMLIMWHLWLKFHQRLLVVLRRSLKYVAWYIWDPFPSVELHELSLVFCSPFALALSSPECRPHHCLWLPPLQSLRTQVSHPLSSFSWPSSLWTLTVCTHYNHG
jgi:hypothetical protein